MVDKCTYTYIFDTCIFDTRIFKKIKSLKKMFLVCRTARPESARTNISKPGSYASTASEKSKYLQVLKSKLHMFSNSLLFVSFKM